MSTSELGTGTMIRVPGGTTTIGSARFYAEECPVREVEVGDVWFDPTPVTNAQFAGFVAATGHVSVAERALDPADFPGADPALLVPGSQLFTQTSRPVPLTDWTQWWRWQEGACWAEPDGPGSTWEAIADHPVVHVGWEDASAYAAWTGKSLPTEVEWEYAARGGLQGADYAWGDEFTPDGEVLANTWQGRFPWRSDDSRGHHRTSPVGSYPPNGHGLYDLIGNVWEWTRSPWTPTHAGQLQPDSDRQALQEGQSHACCGGASPHRQEGVESTTREPKQLRETDRMVTKGGSHLCSPEYCRRYRPAARQGHGIRDTTSHLGFRCVVRD